MTNPYLFDEWTDGETKHYQEISDPGMRTIYWFFNVSENHIERTRFMLKAFKKSDDDYATLVSMNGRPEVLHGLEKRFENFN